MNTTIGKVSATERYPSTVDEFYFWTNKEQILSPFDVVKVKHMKDDEGKETTTFGVIEEMSHITDASSHMSSYISSDFGDTKEVVGNMNRLGMNYIKTRVIHNTKDIYTPVLDGQQVELCDKEDVKKALGLDRVQNPLVCGYLSMYRKPNQIKIPIEINSHFLIGPEGAHLNISGISGLATKTSYAMFLLKAIQEKFKSRNFDNIEDKNQSVAFVLFNVKGRDLLSINEANGDLSPDDKKMYKEMHLSGLPFENVKFYYPYSKNQSTCNVQSYGDTDDICRQIDRNEAFRYKYVFSHDKENIDLLMANEDDTTGTIESIVNVIMNGVGEFSEVQTWKTLKDVIKEKGEKTNEKDAYGIMISSWRKFRRIINNVLDNDIFMPDKRDGNNEVYLSDEIKAIKKNDVMVIDIAQLDEDAQSFVFGDVIRSIKNMKLLKERKDIPSKIIIFVDELNKYASTDVPQRSPIVKQLLDIAERGRSLGIILFAAEQFRSAIYERVKGNCSTHAYGRTNGIELSKPDYKYVPKVYQNMMSRLTQGEYIIQNPIFRSLIHLRFPLPTYKQHKNG